MQGLFRTHHRPALLTSAVGAAVLAIALGARPGSAQVAQPPHALRCDTFANMQTFIDPVNDKCCGDPGEDCSSGVPSTCDYECSSVLDPLLTTVREPCMCSNRSTPLPESMPRHYVS